MKKSCCYCLKLTKFAQESFLLFLFAYNLRLSISNKPKKDDPNTTKKRKAHAKGDKRDSSFSTMVFLASCLSGFASGNPRLVMLLACLSLLNRVTRDVISSFCWRPSAVVLLLES